MNTYIILRCHTTDKQRVMDILLDADEYESSDGFIDCWYELGDDRLERDATRQLVFDNIETLSKHGIESEWFYPEIVRIR